MTHQKALKTGIIASILLVAAILTTTTTTATNVQAVVEDDGELVLPYCDTPEGKAAPGCHDRQDYSEGGKYDGMAPCNDGTYEEDYKDCEDATKSDD